MSEVNHNPDVLTCLANLSNDEVFTPPEVANAVLDMLPAELWTNPNTKILDPATKSGIFLREAAKRLIDGLADKIPDLQERIDHIMQKQLYGYAITELTAHLSRRSLYCSKTANGLYSITQFKTEHGNVLYRRVEHKWKAGKCELCGASQEVMDRGADMETHAYQFIHMDAKTQKELTDMKFDLIIGNPPYQLSDGGNGVSAAPLYHLFVDQAKKLRPRYLSMIIPARWYAGGKGLDSFRDEMLSDSHIRKLVDYETSKECFEGVDIAGGICYFLWDRDNSGNCEVVNISGKNSTSAMRRLNEFPIFIRANSALSIVHKCLAFNEKKVEEIALPRNPFGFPTTARGNCEKKKNDIVLISSKGIGYVSRSTVTKNSRYIDKYKVGIGRLVPSNGELNVSPGEKYRVITDAKIFKPGEVNTETYLDIGVFDTLIEAVNFDAYIHSKFARFLLRQAISSVNVTRDCFRFVPVQDFTRAWSDEDLYAKYKLSQGEIAFIESMIRPMDSLSTSTDGGSDE